MMVPMIHFVSPLRLEVYHGRRTARQQNQGQRPAERIVQAVASVPRTGSGLTGAGGCQVQPGGGRLRAAALDPAGRRFDPSGHSGQLSIPPLERGGVDRYTDYRLRRVGCHDAGQMRSRAGADDEHSDAFVARLLHKPVNAVRRAVQSVRVLGWPRRVIARFGAEQGGAPERVPNATGHRAIIEVDHGQRPDRIGGRDAEQRTKLPANRLL